MRKEGKKDKGMDKMLEIVMKNVKEKKVEEGKLRMIGKIIEEDKLIGRIIKGSINQGQIKKKKEVKVMGKEGQVIEKGSIQKIIELSGIESKEIEEENEGDIVEIEGI